MPVREFFLRLALGVAATAAVVATLVARPAHVKDRTPLVFAGCPGWLFLSDELAAPTDAAAHFAQRIELIRLVARFLKRREITLVVVPVPDKSRVEARSMCGRTRAPVTADRLDRMIAGLRDGGIRVVDIFPALAALEGDAYYRTDSHWNEHGAARAAEAVAAALQEWGLAPRQRAEFSASTGPPHERVGDLYSIAGLAAPAALRPEVDVEAETTIRQSAAAGVGLLDNVSAPELALLGTSFSRVGKFGEFLAMALRAPVDIRAEPGGELIGSAKTYLASSEFAVSPPRVVVWEMPERIMQGPLNRGDLPWARSLAGAGSGG